MMQLNHIFDASATNLTIKYQKQVSKQVSKELHPMITRYALFEGNIHTGQSEAFRAAILADVLPHWQAFPDVIGVRVCFENERDEGAPEMPLILAISYPTRAAVETAPASPQRAAAKAATEAVLERCFTGWIYHHITQAVERVGQVKML
jgi:hypothetical protein